MKQTVPIWVAVLLLAFVAAGQAQTLSYQGSQVCFDFGAGVVSCQSQGTITGYRESQPARQYVGTQPSAGGAAIGSLVGNLLVAWINHQRVKAERRALREEMLAYIDAHADVAAETLKLDEDSVAQLALLKVSDKEHLATWEACEKIMKDQVLLDQRTIALAAEQRAVTSNLEKMFTLCRWPHRGETIPVCARTWHKIALK